MNKDTDFFLMRAKVAATKAINSYLSQQDDGQSVAFISADNLYIVWFCKTLQNWKALVSTDCIDNVYVEVTYNGDKHETYTDLYVKKENSVYGD